MARSPRRPLATGARFWQTDAMAQIGSWIGTLAFSVVFTFLLCLFDLLLRLATPLGRRAIERVGVVFQRCLVATYRLAGVRISLEISPGFEPGRSYVALSNHQSMFDIPLLAWAMPRNFPKYISKRSLARWIPGISYNLRHGGHALIDRSDRDSAVRAIHSLARAVVEDGSTAVIFPEGTRRRDGAMAPFKPAGTLALLDGAPEAPVLPIWLGQAHLTRVVPVKNGAPRPDWLQVMLQGVAVTEGLVPVLNHRVVRMAKAPTQLLVVPTEILMSMPCLPVPVAVADGWPKGVLVGVRSRSPQEVPLPSERIFLPMVAREVAMQEILQTICQEVLNSGLMLPTHKV